MDDVFVAFINKAHPWTVDVVVLAVGAAILVWVYSTISAVRKNINAENIANQLISMQGKHNALDKKHFELIQKYNRYRTILAGIKSTYAELKYILIQFASGQNIQASAYGLLKSITDRLSTDLKFSAGEVHRCAIWFQVDERNLAMMVASAGFPDYYRNKRTLEIDRSTAGRCYRTKATKYSPDLLPLLACDFVIVFMIPLLSLL